MNLDDNELFIYQRLFDLVARDLPAPDVVIYLQTPDRYCCAARCSERAPRDRGADAPLPSDDYLAELNEAYNHFFFHYTATPLLVVETSQVDLSWGDEAVDDLLRQIKSMSARHAVLRAAHGPSRSRSTSPVAIRSIPVECPDGVVQEDPQADRVARQSQPGARRPVGQVPVVRAGASTTRISSRTCRCVRSARTTSG